MTTITNPIYFNKDYHFFIYETEQHATSSRTHQRAFGTLIENIQELADWCSRDLGKVTFSYPGEAIFVIEKSKFNQRGEQCWNVIIGEKFGWIVVKPYIKFETLNE